jgi:putative N6-adenine-specific DNA methylase
MDLFATCAFGLEKIVYQELKDLNLWVDRTEDGKVYFQGELEELVLTNLWLRSAERVYIKTHQFEVLDFDTLFDQVYAFDWAEIIGPNDQFPVRAKSFKSQLSSEPAIQKIVKKAIVKQLQSGHKTESLPESSNSVYEIQVKIRNNQCVIGLNTSGDSLHKRGYREHQLEAPIKETLAASLIKLSGWNPTRALLDPMCGSGTIAIEAAMIGLNFPPGLGRKFAFQDWQLVPQEIQQKVYSESKEKIRRQLPLEIYASDQDPVAIKVAMHNTKSATMENKIHFANSALENLHWDEIHNTVIIANPPYGEKIGDQTQAENIIRFLGEQYNKKQGNQFFIISPHPNFQKLFGHKADKNRKLFNGTIQCYLYQYL